MVRQYESTPTTFYYKKINELFAEIERVVGGLFRR